MQYSLALACVAGSAFALTTFDPTPVGATPTPVIGGAMGRPDTPSPTPLRTTGPLPDTAIGRPDVSSCLSRLNACQSAGPLNPNCGIAFSGCTAGTSVSYIGGQTPAGFLPTPSPTPSPAPGNGPVPIPGNGTLPIPSNGTNSTGPVTSTIVYFDTQCSCIKTSVSVGPAKPTADVKTTTVINGVPCTIGAAPGGGVVVNGQTVTPGAAPTTIAGVPVAFVPGVGPTAAPSVKIGTATVAAPTGGAGSYGSSGSPGAPSYGSSTPAPKYTGAASANNVAGGLVGGLAAFMAMILA